MHFPIIKLETIDTPVSDFEINLPAEDPCLDTYTDYCGDLYNTEDRKAVINSDWLKRLFDGFATINTEDETITFLDRNTIERNFREYLKELTHKLADEADKEELSGFMFRWAGVDFRDFPTLFYLDYVQTSFSFIEDSVYLAGQTYKIGNIFDAHA